VTTEEAAERVLCGFANGPHIDYFEAALFLELCTEKVVGNTRYFIFPLTAEQKRIFGSDYTGQAHRFRVGGGYLGQSLLGGKSTVIFAGNDPTQFQL
jgi:hypothetical protein